MSSNTEINNDECGWVISIELDDLKMPSYAQKRQKQKLNNREKSI